MGIDELSSVRFLQFPYVEAIAGVFFILTGLSRMFWFVVTFSEVLRNVSTRDIRWASTLVTVSKNWLMALSGISNLH